MTAPEPRPFRRLAWSVALTFTATALVFALAPDSGPWPPRYVDWLDFVVRLEFAAGPLTRQEMAVVVGVPIAVSVTLMVAMTALMLAVIVGSSVAERSARPSPRAWRVATVVAAAALLGWWPLTLSAAADALARTTGLDLLPTVVQPMVASDLLHPFRWWLGLLHQAAFPVVVVGLAVGPAAAWWCAARYRAAETDDADPDRVTLHAVAELLPIFVAAALVVELATGSFGASELLFAINVRLWFDDPTRNVATGVLLLGIGTAFVQCGLRVLAGRPQSDTAERVGTLANEGERNGAVEDGGAGNGTIEDGAIEDGAAEESAMEDGAAEESAAEESNDRDGAREPEAMTELWRRVRASRRAKVALAMLAVLALAASYPRLWFDAGPSDIVSTDAPAPPTPRHWLGVDALGHDQLVRLAAALGGSAFVAAVAATLTMVAAVLILGSTRVSRMPRLTAVADILGVGFAVWLLMSYAGPPYVLLASDTTRLELAIMLGALGTPLGVHALRRLPGHHAGLRSARPVAGAWLILAAAAAAAELAVASLVMRLDERSPTLGALLADAIRSGSPLELLHAPTLVSHWPNLWFPPAVATAILAISLALLASAVLQRSSRRYTSLRLGVSGGQAIDA